MNKIYVRACGLTILLMMPWLAYAAGLGKLTLGSSLGQPLKAEVELVSVIAEEISSLTARVASPEAFRQARLIYAPYHSSLLVSVEKRLNGQPYIQITSPQSINEPFVNLLIELNGLSGRLLREYTVLLDPVEAHIVESAVPVVQQASDSLQITPEAREAIPSKSSAIQRSAANGASSHRQEIGTYGPVVQGDTLTKIARQVSPEGVDFNRMLAALYQANQNAFFEKNMNLLKVGVVLRVPDQNEISAISQREANREIEGQIANWDAYRERMADAAMGFSPTTKLKPFAGGRISTTIKEEDPVIRNAPSEEVLTLSKGELPESLQASENFDREKTSTTQDYLRMMEEDTIAKDRALKEANERVALLEQNIERLQHLIEIKATGLTDAQIRAGQSLAQVDSALPPASASDEIEVASLDLIDLAVTHERNQTEYAEVITSVQSVIPEQAVNQEAQLPDSSEPIESTLPDHTNSFVTANLELGGAALAVLLTGWLGISLLRRRRKRSDDIYDVFDYPEETQKSNISASGMTELAPTETMTQKSDDAQTKKKELVLGFSEDSKFFKSEESKGNLSESASGFFFGKNINESLVADRNVDSDSHHAKIKSDHSMDAIVKPEHEIKFDIKNPSNHYLAVSTNRAQKADEPEMSVTKNKAVPDLEFTLNLETERTEKQNTSSDEKGAPFSFDFSDDVKVSSDSATTLDKEVKPLSLRDDDQPAPQFNLGDIKLDLDDEFDKTSKAVAHAEDASTPWNEVAVKIDLAKAYLEMNDKEGAREILEEVMLEGNEGQQAIAKAMLKGLV